MGACVERRWWWREPLMHEIQWWRQLEDGCHKVHVKTQGHIVHAVKGHMYLVPKGSRVTGRTSLG